ncbi:MAG: aminotransferase class V-fold PLP-dependent enzyme [Bacteroidales bacterium]|nr:aminotransferase class V-fold PLP-dependent enzyme [Bacteroidales bacterium]
MEKFFEPFRNNIIGHQQSFTTPYGERQMIYADWIGSGRYYRPIEDRLVNQFGPYIGNTHTETSTTGTLMTNAYHYAQHLIKQHVNAGENDAIIFAGSGMTAAINKMQRILGLKSCGVLKKKECIREKERPVVFITHMEHHSNHTSWYETIADVVQLKPDNNLLVDLNDLEEKLKAYRDRKLKIGSFTAASNVTGIETAYHKMARLMHEYNGLCFVDFAASAPYVDINMHPGDDMDKLDGIFFSPHKFLGGPGTSGIMIFDSNIYKSPVPDHPGGGTVDWTNPWGEYKYIDDVEAREDGGTPGFLQAIKASLACELKQQMHPVNMRKREDQLLEKAFPRMEAMNGVNILADQIKERLGVISFYIDEVHYNLGVKLLNDLAGIQTRGGCACAGTYGHFLLNVSYEDSHRITELINHGDLSMKPGWIRISLHPTMTDQELETFLDTLEYITENHRELAKDYHYNNHTNEYHHRSEPEDKTPYVTQWFKL